jgi:hypothetical protein
VGHAALRRLAHRAHIDDVHLVQLAVKRRVRARPRSRRGRPR